MRGIAGLGFHRLSFWKKNVAESLPFARYCYEGKMKEGSMASSPQQGTDAEKAPSGHYRIAALRASFPHTVPILAGFWFLSLTYGVYMHTLGFSFVWPMAMAAIIYGGSLEFVIAGMLVSPFAPLTTLLVTLAVQARHLFYGIAMLDRYKNTGWMKPYLIFGMCDETFSILCSTDAPEGIDRRWFMFWVTLLDQLYWVCGAAMGDLVGSLITFDTKGLSFVMTALFVVILLDQVLKEHDHVPTAIGAIAAVVALVVLGPDNFMIPALVATALILVAIRGKREDAR